LLSRRATAANEAIETLGVVEQGPDQLVSDLRRQSAKGDGTSAREPPSVLVLIDPIAGVDVKSVKRLARGRKYRAARASDPVGAAS
jgi:hypothetical protein